MAPYAPPAPCQSARPAPRLRPLAVLPRGLLRTLSSGRPAMLPGGFCCTLTRAVAQAMGRNRLADDKIVHSCWKHLAPCQEAQIVPLRPQRGAPTPAHRACLYRSGLAWSPQGEASDGWCHRDGTPQGERPTAVDPGERGRAPIGHAGGHSSGLFHGWDGACPLSHACDNARDGPADAWEKFSMRRHGTGLCSELYAVCKTSGFDNSLRP